MLSSKEEANIIIGYNILKFYEGNINSELFLKLLSTNQAFKKNKSGNSKKHVDEIIKLTEELILRCLPPVIWAHFKHLSNRFLLGEKEIMKIELLSFFINFSVNRYQIEQYALRRWSENNLIFLINLDENEQMPREIDNIKFIKSYKVLRIKIKFIGKGDIAPTLKRIEKLLDITDDLHLFSLEKGGLDLGLSSGTFNGRGRKISFSNFYCKNTCSIKFPNIRRLEWWKGGDLMENIGESFPKLKELRIRKSKFDRFNVSSVKATLKRLLISDLNWKGSYTSELRELEYLKILKISNCNWKEIPEEVLLLTKLEEMRIRNNPLSKFPVFVQKMKVLKHLSLVNNKIKEIPADLEFVNLYILNLLYNPIKIIDFSVTKNSSLPDIQLGFRGGEIELSKKFVIGHLNRGLKVSFSTCMPKIKLPNVEEVNVPLNTCRGRLYFIESQIESNIMYRYKEKYPNFLIVRYWVW